MRWGGLGENEMEKFDSSKTNVLASGPDPISFQCSGSTSSKCERKMCTVVCSDGHKVGAISGILKLTSHLTYFRFNFTVKMKV
jgi:hypothetical protein